MGNLNYRCENGIVSIKIKNKWIVPSFERYEKIEPIGEPGANGVVLKAIHKTTRRVDAVKIWLPRGNSEEIRKEQYLCEVQKIAKLNDSRIATIHDAWVENECYCCSMEYIDGRTYEKWLEYNHNIYKRISMLLNIFDAIVLYQSKGIIHGDIHSKNILIDKEEKVHIIDFGTSAFSQYEKQSIHRENYLMYELIEKTLEDTFDKNAFIFRKFSLKGKVEDDIDIRNAVPIIFSKSVISYLHIIEILKNCNCSINLENMYSCCRYIASGDYLNLDYFYSMIVVENCNAKEPFCNIMFECLEDEMYENAQDDFNEATIMEYLSLYVYYNFVRDNCLSSESDKNQLFVYFNYYNLYDNPQVIFNYFCESEDLFEFHNCLLRESENKESINMIEKSLRVLLYQCIEEKSKESLLKVIREIQLEIDLLRMDKSKVDKILKLSYVYCENNGIEELF